MSSVELASLIAGASRSARTLAMAGLRSRYPDASERELTVRWACTHAGRRTGASRCIPTLIGCSCGRRDGAHRYRPRRDGRARRVHHSVHDWRLPGELVQRRTSSVDRRRHSRRHRTRTSRSAGRPSWELVLCRPRCPAPGDRRSLLRQPCPSPDGNQGRSLRRRFALDRQQLERRRRVRVAADPDRFVYVHSPEDILLQKLHWYRLGGQVSDCQWRDVLSIIVVQQTRLDQAYFDQSAAREGLSQLLGQALREAESS